MFSVNNSETVMLNNSFLPSGAGDGIFQPALS